MKIGWMKMGKPLRVSLLTVALLLPAGLATAQDVQEEGPTLEFRSNVPWARLELDGRQSVAGVSPLQVPGPINGDFWLTAKGRGVEKERGRVRIKLDENGSRIVEYGPAPTRQAVMRSIVFPGMSQMRSRERGKGLMFALTGATAAGFTLWAHNDWRNAEDRSESVLAALTTVPDSLLAETQESLRDARSEENHLRARRDAFLRTAAITWGLSFVDALFFAPDFHVGSADESSLGVTMQRKSRGQAFFRSLVFPGLGQEYNGDRRKAFWVATGGVLAGSYYLWRQDDLDRAKAYLSQAELRVAESSSAQNLAARDGRIGEVDDAMRERDTAQLVLAGFWAFSLLDTLLSFEEPWGAVPVASADGGFGLNLDPANGSLAAELHF